MLSTVGRLDRETSGLLLLTDDGGLLHRIISPKSKLPKVYEVELSEDLRGDEVALFASGMLMLESEKTPLLPAELEVLEARRARLVLHEGRYHQVRRMFAATGNHVQASAPQPRRRAGPAGAGRRAMAAAHFHRPGYVVRSMTPFAALPFLPDAVIFDMDGLMIDSERVSLACWSEAADEFGLGLEEAVFLRMVGLGDHDTHALLRAQGIEDSVIDAVAARCHELYEARTQTGLPLRPGILELLELLKAHAVPRAVATTTRQPRANRSWRPQACCRTSMP